MYTDLVVNPPSGRKRRRHSEAFKTQVIEACLQPGVSAAAVALANQINANMLRTWVREYRSQHGNGMPAEVTDRNEPATTTLVPVQVEQPAVQAVGDIHIEVRQSRRVVQVNWPMAEASRCALWLKEFLGVISPSQVWLAIEPVDMRAGIDGLSLRIQEALGRSPCDGSAYAFRNRRGNRLKLIVWDGTGVWLCHRRLHRGHFTWPTADTPVCTLTAAQWNWLVTGVEWHRLTASASAHWRV